MKAINIGRERAKMIGKQKNSGLNGAWLYFLSLNRCFSEKMHKKSALLSSTMHF